MTFLRVALLATLAFALSTELRAIDAGDMDPHLPDAVIIASMRFQAFTRKAEDKKMWEKKHAELLGLLNAELEKASTSDNRAATALRTLIKDLKDAKYVKPKKDKKKKPDKYVVLPNGNRVMVKEDFHIGVGKGQPRVLTYPFKVDSVPAMIRVGIGGGSDDSADGGLHYLLIDPVGRVIKRGFSDKDEFVWEEKQSTRTGTWKVIIEDFDTDVRDKKSPGNRGAIEVLVKAD